MAQQRQLISAESAQSPFFVGVDLGGTSVKVGVVDDLGRQVRMADDQGNPTHRLSIPTETEKGAEDATRRMGEAVKRAIQASDVDFSSVARVGLGSPGTMDIPAGMLVDPVNLRGEGWKGFPIRDRLSQHCGKPVAFANDAAAAAYGEFWIGSGRDFHSMVLLTLGTGIGCGIIIGGVSVDGENSHGAECGHIIIDCSEDARVCGCGQPGHLEAYASATAVIKRTREALDSGRASSLSERIRKEEEKEENQRKGIPELIAEEAEAGDALALELVLETARYLGIGVVSLVHTIDPTGVLLGGAMTFGGNESELGRRFLARIREEVQRRAFEVLAERTAVDFASLGGDAGYIGAAGIARAEHLKSR
ncbi:MAG: ROK family protein [Planctomycetes bacterium]|nr:ROK family protein [Planctomycetota bacterium]